MTQALRRIAGTLPITLKSIPLIRGPAIRIERALRDIPYDEVAQNLFVGSSASGLLYPDDFDHRISVAANLEHHGTTHSFELVPRGEHQYDEFESAVDAVRGLWSEQETVLIHCYEGRERAPSIAATALAARRGWTFEKAIEFIRTKRTPVEPTPELRTDAETYLEQNTD